ncbi:MAG: transposase [Muribaculaceae bacterium]|nr:transposase [Muribaculaceae bacterium]
MAIFRKYSRARWLDYAAGIVFITICTQSRRHYFGSIQNDEMQLSAIGKITTEAFNKIANHYPQAELHRFVVMPNHVHAIIKINGTRADKNRLGCLRAKEHEVIHAGQTTSERFHHNTPMALVIGGFKAAVTRQARKINAAFQWQSGFHDHLIRNQREYDYIADYIDNNPRNWRSDRFMASEL